MFDKIKKAFRLAKLTGSCHDCYYISESEKINWKGNPKVDVHSAFRLIENENGYWLLLWNKKSGVWVHYPATIRAFENLVSSVQMTKTMDDGYGGNSLIKEIAERYKIE